MPGPGLDLVGVEELQEVIATVRNLRAEYGVQPGAKVRLRVRDEAGGLLALLGGSERILADLARIEDVSARTNSAEIGASAVLRSGAELFLPLEGIIDLDRERARLRAELERTVARMHASGVAHLDLGRLGARRRRHLQAHGRERGGAVGGEVAPAAAVTDLDPADRVGGVLPAHARAGGDGVEADLLDLVEVQRGELLEEVEHRLEGDVGPVREDVVAAQRECPAVGAGAAAPSPDPRVGLSAGLMDAGEAIWNLSLLSKTPPPEGMG